MNTKSAIDLIEMLNSALTRTDCATASVKIKSRKKGGKWLFRVGNAAEAPSLHQALYEFLRLERNR